MKIENYRPITLLETELQTAYQNGSKKLGKVCQKLIHEASRLCPRKKPVDHTRLAHLMVDYAEKRGQNDV